MARLQPLPHLAFLTAMFFCAPANATWTIVAVDPVTREVGSAGASCTSFVMGVAEAIPGKGALVVQAQSSVAARERARAMLLEGHDARAIIAAIRDPAFKPAAQQYGVVVLGDPGGKPTAAAFTGADTRPARGEYVGADFTVQGNILAADDVLAAAVEAFNGARGLALADRLLLALEAGSAKGGDSRCGAKTAQSAYLMVARPDNAMGMASSIFRVTDLNDGRNPITLVRQEYDSRKRDMAPKR
jgi:uncharacterized Ntn-hydrolase superfamily protein